MTDLYCLNLAPMCAIFLLLQGVQGISDIITIPGLVNVDFADVKSIMCNSGTAMLGVGVSTGKNRAEEAAMVVYLHWMLTVFLIHHYQHVMSAMSLALHKPTATSLTCRNDTFLNLHDHVSLELNGCIYLEQFAPFKAA